MVKSTMFDPFMMWKSMYEQTEENWSEVLEEAMKKESFSKELGQTLDYYLGFQEFVHKVTEDYLKQVNMPTRTEVADVASLIINVEEKVETLEESLEEQLEEVDTSKQVAQVRRTVNNLEKKMDLILEKLEKQEQNELNETKSNSQQKTTKNKK